MISLDTNQIQARVCGVVSAVYSLKRMRIFSYPKYNFAFIIEMADVEK